MVELNQLDWDFRGVEDWELVACCRYEFARQSESFVNSYDHQIPFPQILGLNYRAKIGGKLLAFPNPFQPRLPIAPTPTAPPTSASGMTWTGEIPHQKWMNFYTKVLSKFASARGLKLTLKVEATQEGGVSKQKLDETKSALRELGLNDDVRGTQ